MGDWLTTLDDFEYNFEGQVSSTQKQDLIQQEANACVAAGGDPAECASQAQSDVSTALKTFTGSGAFGVNWTGADPSQSGWGTNAAQQAAQGLVNAVAPIPSWVWWVGGGIVALLVFGVVKEAL